MFLVSGHRREHCRKQGYRKESERNLMSAQVSFCLVAPRTTWNWMTRSILPLSMMMRRAGIITVRFLPCKKTFLQPDYAVCSSLISHQPPDPHHDLCERIWEGAITEAEADELSCQTLVPMCTHQFYAIIFCRATKG